MSAAYQEGRRVTPREMVRSHAFPVLAALSTISLIVIAWSLIPISRQAARWNGCFEESLRWQRRDFSTESKTISKLWATRYCNGGSLPMPRK
ncbi:Ets-domain-containing protein [Prochlorococcus sp. MIT 1306]|uniref:Ets-domain-containing protein n=1 Tax=Prochlorococcus sp. MIT 1306 TaxID=1799667 RepID=UPI001E36B04C|nr:Ets-domain-containing protein [Prochlorococcus sp. MIT 1306]